MISASDKSHETSYALDRNTGLILRISIIISLALIIAGLLIFFFTDTIHLTGLTPASSLIADIIKLNPAALITSGFIIILFMPAAILIISFTHFIVAHELKPLIICIVLVVMLAASYILILK